MRHTIRDSHLKMKCVGVTRAGIRRRSDKWADARRRHRTRAAAGDIALICVFALCVTLAVLPFTPQFPAPEATSWTAVSVKRDVTLWDLAAAHPVPGLTTAETVDLIRLNNHLASADLSAGQRLVVPRAGQATGVASQR